MYLKYFLQNSRFDAKFFFQPTPEWESLRIILPPGRCGKVMFSAVFIQQSVSQFVDREGGSHVTITHDALDLNA